MKNQSAINSDAYAYIQKVINPDVKILSAEIRGKYLRVELSSGCTFSVRNGKFKLSGVDINK